MKKFLPQKLLPQRFRNPRRDSMTADEMLRAVDQYFGRGDNNVYQQRQRGLYNSASGLGGATDKSSFFQLLPIWLNDPTYPEKICNQSWTAERFVSMPIDDMFAKPRVYENEPFQNEVTRLNVDKKFANSLKLARKYGTGLFWLITKEAPSETPLDISRIRKGDAANCIAIDRTDVTIVTRTSNPMSSNFGKPEIYRLNIQGFGTVNVHHSRIYRSDGQESESVNGWRIYEKDWGVSSLIKVFSDVCNDAAVVEAISQLMQESSIPVHKVEGLNEILCRGKLADEPDVDDMMREINLKKSIYRTVFMDSDDEFERTSVNFSNIPDLMDRFEERLAMASGLSVTRFLGKAPSGLNATGEGDQRNDSKTTRIRQTQVLEPFYTWADPIIARSAGTTVPIYSFPPLFEMSEKEVSDMDFNRSRSANLMVKEGVWSPEEAKIYIATGQKPTGKIATATKKSVDKT